ncbi:receptor like protein 21 isoform X1 [Vitis vinifera]|uniref:receptor like protein 21 isoform X1 n=1 Tax=Vitis vinifera TaxID=29760 RepID=UPI00053FA0D5|nr:receptor like protein 21 isoform X1 [Vitis vinifera]|eukprot:XP_010655035.1 PREDICTED: brassinosteroid LRR receptor kinase isoform X1 [Vitis vinifera]
MSLMCGLSMESLSSKYLSWVLLLLLIQICRCGGCNEEEKMGLLEFKAFLKLNNEKADLLLPSWIGNNISECCSWERVICDPTTSRVKKLSLNNIRQQQILLEDYGWSNYENDKFWLLNTSLFLPFEELQDLNLSANSFDGFIKNEGFKSLSSLKKLEILDISGNEFDKSVIKSLSTITSLKTLVLCSIGLEGSFPVQELASLRSLEALDLSYNNLESFQQVQDSKSLSILKKLETLNLNQNKFRNTTMQQLNTFASLKSLSLQSNYLEGFFPIQELHALENLVMLDLSLNHLTGMQDSKSLSIFKKLETLNLNDNMFKNTSLKQLNIFTSLRNLSLQWNDVGAFFPIQELCTLENLVMLDLSGNFLIGMQGFKSLPKLKKLEILNLSYNQFNKTNIKHLSGFTSLKTLVVSSNNIEGFFPFEDFASLSNLEILDLSYNSLSGIIPSSIRLMSHLKSLYLVENNLNGSLQNQGFCQLNKLQQLDLSYNLFQGILPPCFNNLTSLRLLDLSYNQLSGNVSPSLLPNLTSLEYINLSHNQFEGSFSISSLANHSKLQVVILGSDNNKFEVETEYPAGWVPLFQLKGLVLSSCKLTGDLPGFLQYQFRLVGVDLSHNNLTGSFPNWLLENNTRLEFLLLRNNSLMGQLLPLRPNTRISSLDISHN